MAELAQDSSFAAVGGAEIAYESTGSGRTVVLIHAGIADQRMWDGQVAAFAATYHVVCYDLRGFGRTRASKESFSHVEDLRGFLRHLGIARAHLIGASKGGSVALDFALVYPDVVASLVLVATTPSGYPRSEFTLNGWKEGDAALERGDVQRAIDVDLEMWVDGPNRSTHVVDPEVRRWLRELVAGTYAAEEAGPEVPLVPRAATRLPEVQAPTLIVVGDQDVPEMLPAAEQLAREIPRAQKVVIPGVAHLVNVERPEAFNAIVLEFLGKQMQSA